MPKLKRTVVWRSLFWPGAEFCQVKSLNSGWLLHGTVLAVYHRQPMRLEYRVKCNSVWQTRSVEVRQWLGDQERKLVWRIDSQRRWWQGSRQLRGLRGCEDVDLQFSPITNTLPIRRLQLEIGQSAQVRAAWVRLPHLKMTILHQCYTRITRSRYLYQSATGFSAELMLDNFGLVKTYPKLWERVSAV